MNLRANFDKNKKASRIKALREFSMKRLTDFFGEKDWKTVEIRYNENMKRSKHCCWTVPIRDWNSSGRSQKISGSFSIMLNCTYERLKHKCANITEFVISNPKKMLNRTYERLKRNPADRSNAVQLVEPYLWVIET